VAERDAWRRATGRAPGCGPLGEAWAAATEVGAGFEYAADAAAAEEDEEVYLAALSPCEVTLPPCPDDAPCPVPAARVGADPAASTPLWQRLAPAAERLPSAAAAAMSRPTVRYSDPWGHGAWGPHGGGDGTGARAPAAASATSAPLDPASFTPLGSAFGALGARAARFLPAGARSALGGARKAAGGAAEALFPPPGTRGARVVPPPLLTPSSFAAAWGDAIADRIAAPPATRNAPDDLFTPPEGAPGDPPRRLGETDVDNSLRPRYGYHVPPFTSVDHLHLHCLAGTFESRWKEAKYAEGAPWWRASREAGRALAKRAEGLV